MAETACEIIFAPRDTADRAAPASVVLAPLPQRERFGLNQRQFLLAMAALALEMDGGMRAAFRAAIAHELGLPLLRAGLPQIMDKYVGETEEHLGRLLQSARENRRVLLFDEADAIFGKRTSVSTGHDKFANLSTSF